MVVVVFLGRPRPRRGSAPLEDFCKYKTPSPIITRSALARSCILTFDRDLQTQVSCGPLMTNTRAIGRGQGSFSSQVKSGNKRTCKCGRQQVDIGTHSARPRTYASCIGADPSSQFRREHGTATLTDPPINSFAVMFYS